VVSRLSKILVTAPADEKFRKAFVDELASIGDVEFLSDIPRNKRSSALAHADVLISWRLERELKSSEFAAIPNVKLLQFLSAGVDHLPFSKLPPTVRIASNAGAYAEQMAEHTIAMMLATYKNLLDEHKKLVKGIFDQESESRRLQGASCVILGFGGIGKACAKRLHCFKVKIYAINTSGKTNEPVDFIGTLEDLEYVLRLADVVIVSIPLTKTTRNLIGKREFTWMKDDATIVNVARGDIINEAALYRKLKTHPNFHAAIDTWWLEPSDGKKLRTRYPFLKLPNFLGSPHNSGNVPDAMSVAATYAAENVKRFLRNELISGIVNRNDYR